MSADVMAILRNRVEEAETKWGTPEGSDKQGREALAAVAELVAACKELDAASKAYKDSPYETGPFLGRLMVAEKRYAAALAAFGGES